jgi:hypothetical protein
MKYTINAKVWKAAKIYTFLSYFLLKCSVYDSKYNKHSSTHKTWTSENKETKSFLMAASRTCRFNCTNSKPQHLNQFILSNLPPRSGVCNITLPHLYC